ncbi:MAG: hypothetical protein Q7W05_15325, partial [Deltaproteobacteria bacterium]|nr:hypothetical protein [Deltaproteobacteria bacterium]
MFDTYPLPLLVCFTISIFTVLHIKPQQNLLKTIIISIVVSAIATFFFIYLAPLLPYKLLDVVFFLAIGLLIGFFIIVLNSIYNIFMIAVRLILKHEQVKKDIFKKIVIYA